MQSDDTALRRYAGEHSRRPTVSDCLGF